MAYDIHEYLEDILDWDEEIDRLDEIDEEDLYPEFSDVPVVEKICRPKFHKIRDHDKKKK